MDLVLTNEQILEGRGIRMGGRVDGRMEAGRVEDSSDRTDVCAARQKRAKTSV